MIVITSLLVQIIPVLIAVAMLTIKERKMLGSMQRRIGPSKSGFKGILQAISDALKLIIKEFLIPEQSYRKIFILSALLSLIMSLSIWIILPIYTGIYLIEIQNNILLGIIISGISIYSILLSGWSGNSKYGLLGSIRSSSQMISYELSLTLILIFIVLGDYYNYSDIILVQSKYWNFVLFLPVSILYLISIFAETNRAPFDLPEAESELVSGFNTEYSSLPFALFFLAEYGFIISQSFIFIFLFAGGSNLIFFYISDIFQPFVLLFKVSIILYLFILVRGSLPRFRYDLLLALAWNFILPFILLSLSSLIIYF